MDSGCGWMDGGVSECACVRECTVGVGFGLLCSDDGGWVDERVQCSLRRSPIRTRTHTHTHTPTHARTHAHMHAPHTDAPSRFFRIVLFFSFGQNRTLHHHHGCAPPKGQTQTTQRRAGESCASDTHASYARISRPIPVTVAVHEHNARVLGFICCFISQLCCLMSVCSAYVSLLFLFFFLILLIFLVFFLVSNANSLNNFCWQSTNSRNDLGSRTKGTTTQHLQNAMQQRPLSLAVGHRGSRSRTRPTFT
jgi:hypothetical protein